MYYFIIITVYLMFFKINCAPVNNDCCKYKYLDDNIQCDCPNGSLSEEIFSKLMQNVSQRSTNYPNNESNKETFDILFNEDYNSNMDATTILTKDIIEETLLPTSKSSVVKHRDLSETFEPDDLPTNAPWPVDFSSELPSNAFTVSPDLVETEHKPFLHEGISITNISENQPEILHGNNDDLLTIGPLPFGVNKNEAINSVNNLSNKETGISSIVSALDSNNLKFFNSNHSNTITETLDQANSTGNNILSEETFVNLNESKNSSTDSSGVDESYSTDNGKETDVMVITESMIETDKGFEEDIEELNKTDIDEKTKEINSLREDLEDLVNGNRSGMINMTIHKESIQKLKEKLNISTAATNETLKSKLFGLTNHLLNGSNLLLNASSNINRTHSIPLILSRLNSSADSTNVSTVTESTLLKSTQTTINYQDALRNCPRQFFRQVYSKLLKKHFKDKLPIPLCADLFAYYMLNRPVNSLTRF